MLAHIDFYKDWGRKIALTRQHVFAIIAVLARPIPEKRLRQPPASVLHNRRQGRFFIVFDLTDIGNHK